MWHGAARFGTVKSGDKGGVRTSTVSSHLISETAPLRGLHTTGDMARCGTVRRNVARCGAMWHGAARFGTVKSGHKGGVRTSTGSSHIIPKTAPLSILHTTGGMARCGTVRHGVVW